MRMRICAKCGHEDNMVYPMKLRYVAADLANEYIRVTCPRCSASWHEPCRRRQERRSETDD
jgi:RNase P subunit RPR2